MSFCIAVAAATLFLLACATDGVVVSPHPGLKPVWGDYLALPGERALAIAGDPRRNRWVTGSSGGQDTHVQAEADALIQCRTQRRRRRLQAPCVLYAVGNEIVWRGP